MLRAPETEALLGQSPHLEPRDPRVDGSTMPLGSTAIHETTGVSKTLWGRWKSPDAAGLKPCGSRSTAIPYKGISAIINNHRGTSGGRRVGMLYMYPEIFFYNFNHYEGRCSLYFWRVYHALEEFHEASSRWEFSHNYEIYIS